MFKLCILITKISNLLINLLNVGTGNTWPGYLVLKICPNIFKLHKFNYPKGIILVSGTNGKTTTVKLITHILEHANFKVNSNKSGANLLNGVLTTLLLDCNLDGDLKSDIAVLEVDEFTLPQIVELLAPNIVLLLNLSRDQLDRYGEIDTILLKWKISLSALPSPTLVVLDETESTFQTLSESINRDVIYFDEGANLFINNDLEGVFNKKNISAALVVTKALGVENSKALTYLSDFKPAYGRGEILKFQKNTYTIFLAKNPKSLNNNLDMLLSNKNKYSCVLFVLNDDPRDGRDVSWFYDVSASKILDACRDLDVYVSGTRFFDFAVRLHYANVDVPKSNLFDRLQNCIFYLSTTYKDQNILVFPNYSAMLEIRKVITGKKIL